MATVSVAATSGTWALGLPAQTWTLLAGTVTVAGTSGTWSVAAGGRAVPTFRSASGWANWAGGASSIAIPKPSGTVSGDLLVAVNFCADGYYEPTRWTAPAGWTVVQKLLTGNAPIIGLAWKIAGGSEPTTYSFGIDTGSNPEAAIVCVQTGTFNATTPINTHAMAFDATAGATVVHRRSPRRWATVSVSATGWSTTRPVWTPAGTWTERLDHSDNGNNSAHVATKDLTASATGTVTATVGASVPANGGAHALVAINPT